MSGSLPRGLMDMFNVGSFRVAPSAAPRAKRRLPIVKNKSDYRTEDLRALFRAGLEDMGASLDKVIRVIHRGHTKASHAYLGNGCPGGEARSITMVIDKADPTRCGRGGSFAGTFRHEVLHTLGLNHGDMNRADLYGSGPQPWADGFVIRRKASAEPKPAPTVLDRVAEREAAVRASLAKWEDRLVRAERKVRKYRAAVKGYARRAEERVEAEREAARALAEAAKPKRPQPAGLARWRAQQAAAKTNGGGS